MSKISLYVWSLGFRVWGLGFWDFTLAIKYAFDALSLFLEQKNNLQGQSAAVITDETNFQ